MSTITSQDWLLLLKFMQNINEKTLFFICAHSSVNMCFKYLSGSVKMTVDKLCVLYKYTLTRITPSSEFYIEIQWMSHLKSHTFRKYFIEEMWISEGLADSALTTLFGVIWIPKPLAVAVLTNILQRWEWVDLHSWDPFMLVLRSGADNSLQQITAFCKANMQSAQCGNAMQC